MALRSIRGRLTVFLLSGVVLLVLLSAIVLWFVVRSSVEGEFDRVLEAEARGLMVLTAREGDRIEADFEDWVASVSAEIHEEEDEDSEDGDEDDDDDDDDDEKGDESDGAYFQLFLEDGTLVKKSGGLGDNTLPFVATEKVLFEDVELPDGSQGRLVQVSFFPDVDEEDPEGAQVDENLVPLPPQIHGKPVKLVLVVARDREPLEELLGTLALALGLVGLVLVAGTAVIVRVAVRKGFQPLDAFRSQVGEIGPDSLDQRVALPDPPEELESAVTALNDLLERVESGFERERRFSDDVAHELRTPLTEVLTACEVGEKWPEDPEATKQLFGDLRESAIHLRNIVTTLLELARCESGTVVLKSEEISVKELIVECWERRKERAQGKSIVLQGPDRDLEVVSDPDRLRMILQNVLDNAVSHGDRESAVMVELREGEVGILEISNQASAMSAYDVRHVFDRFWQKDSARTTRDQSGLGLSIVRALCQLLGIAVRAELVEEKRFMISLAIPGTRESTEKSAP